MPTPPKLSYHDLLAAVGESSTDRVREIVASGVDPSAPPSRCQAALCRAIERNDLAMVRCLLDIGADPSRATPTGEIAMNLACACDCVAITQLLLDYGADPNAMGIGDTPLMHAASNGSMGCVHLLLDRGRASRCRARPEAMIPIAPSRH
jgi:ankyrin repeat protein